MPRADLIQVRGGTTVEWLAVDPVLAVREIGIDTDEKIVKFGNGVDPWSGLESYGGSLTPWSEDVDAASFELENVARIVAGNDGDTPTVGILVGRSLLLGIGSGSSPAQHEFAAGESVVEAHIGPAYNFITVDGGSLIGLDCAPFVAVDANTQDLGEVVGLMGRPVITGTGNPLITQMHGVEALPNFGVIGGTLSLMRGVWAQLGRTFGSITQGVGVDIETSAGFGTIAEVIGLRINQLVGTSVWGLQVADVKSYHQGDLRVGHDSAAVAAAPTAKLEVVQPILGSSVQKLRSLATNDDVIENVIQGRIATTNATPTAVLTVPIPASTTVGIDVTVVARRTGGSAGTAEDAAHYKRIVTYKNVAGVPTAVGTASAVHTAENQAGWDVTFVVSGANVEVRVTGALNNNVTWQATARIHQVSS